ncbi:MAG: insulinase family protein [Bacteroidales bacterium]|jgi:predicted Zn-dependent peptidase|nr:insulinase family protein [Bacteroidales bacterium]
MKNSSKVILPNLTPHKELLDNGVKLYWFPNDDMPLVKMEFLFSKAGTIYQDKLLSSVAANYLLTEGTNKFSAKQIAEHIDYYGVFVDKSVEKEVSSICFYFQKKYKDELFDYFSQIILSPTFEEREKEIYMQRLEKQHYINMEKTEYIARVVFNSLLFGDGNPYGKYAITNDYSSLKRDDIINFYNKFYLPSNCSIILSGGIDEEIISLVKKSFSLKTWKESKIEASIKGIDYPENKRKERVLELDNKVQASIVMGCLTANIHNEDFISLDVLNCLLGGYFGSRLMKNVREDKGYTYGISSSLYSYKDVGVFLIASSLKKKSISNALKEIYKEIEILKTEPVREEELFRVKRYMEGDLLRSLDGSFDISDRFRFLLKHNLPLDYYDRYLEKINLITEKDILFVANKYLDKEKMIEIVAK